MVFTFLGGKALLKKVLVIGCPGSGKSTFARALGKITGLPVIHLDRLNWREDATNVPREVFLARLEEALRGESWIIDGNYGATLEKRLKACDTVFFLDLDVGTCLEGVRLRKGQPRSDLPWLEPEADDLEFLEFIRNYPVNDRPRVLAMLKQYQDKRQFAFTSHAQMAAWLAGLEAQGSLG